MDKNELYHYGVLGMKWGRRRYQHKDGTLTSAGKKRYNKELEKLKAEQKIVKNKLRTKAKIDKLEAMRNEIDEAKRTLNGEKSAKTKREPATLSPDAKTIYENRHNLTDKEIQDAWNRLSNERNIKSLIPEQKSAGKRFIEAFCNTSKTTKSVVDASDDFYKSMEKGMQLIDKMSKKGKQK